MAIKALFSSIEVPETPIKVVFSPVILKYLRGEPEAVSSVMLRIFS